MIDLSTIRAILVESLLLGVIVCGLDFGATIATAATSEFSKPGAKDAPLFIKSDSLELDAKNRVFVYKENVEAKRDDLHITSDVMRGNYDTNNRLQQITCEGNVVITRGAELRASSEHAVYTVKDATVVLTLGPELQNQGNSLTADIVTVYLDEDRSEAEGNVRVKILENRTEGGPTL